MKKRKRRTALVGFALWRKPLLQMMSIVPTMILDGHLMYNLSTTTDPLKIVAWTLICLVPRVLNHLGSPRR